jgi:hypothetical protein
LKNIQFLQPQVDYLGFLLDDKGIRPSRTKVVALRSNKKPQSQAELKSFTGMVTYYLRFARDISGVLHPLFQFARSDIWKWGPTEDKAYNGISNVIDTRVLVPYSLTKPLRLTSDASPIGAAAIISHVEGEVEFPIALAEKSLQQQRNDMPSIRGKLQLLVSGLRNSTNICMVVILKLSRIISPLLPFLVPWIMSDP